MDTERANYSIRRTARLFDVTKFDETTFGRSV